MNPNLAAHPTGKPSSKHGCLLIFLILMGCGGLVVSVLVGWYIVGRAQDASVTRRIETEARQRGEPVTLVEFAATLPAVPDASNAALALIDLWKPEEPALWNAFLAGHDSLPERASKDYSDDLPYLGKNARRVERGVSLSPASRKAAESLVASQAEHLDGVRKALRRPECRWPAKLGHISPLPYLDQLKAEANVLRVRALLAAERGDLDGWLDGMERIMELSRTLRNDPPLISQLVRVALLQMTVESAEQLLSRNSLDPEKLRQLERLDKGLEMKDSLKWALIAERAMMLSLYDGSSPAYAQVSRQAQQARPESKVGQGDMAVVMLKYRLSGLGMADRRLTMETLSKAIRLVEHDTPTTLQQLEALSASSEQQAGKFPPKLIFCMLSPAFTRVYIKFETLEARRRAMRVAMAIESYRAAHQGSIPKNLSGLVPQFIPELPLDPFDGQTIRFRRLDKGYVVYSVGSDRSDDGGKERIPNSSTRNSDETFTVAR